MPLATQAAVPTMQLKAEVVKAGVQDEDTTETTEGSCTSDNENSSSNDSQSEKLSEVKELFSESICSRRAALRGLGNGVLKELSFTPPAQQRRNARKEARSSKKQQLDTNAKAEIPTLPPGLEDYHSASNLKQSQSSSGVRHQERSSHSELLPVKVHTEGQATGEQSTMLPMKKRPLLGGAAFNPISFDRMEPLKKRVSDFLLQEPPRNAMW